MIQEQARSISRQETSDTLSSDWPDLLRDARAGDETAIAEICERLQRYLRTVITGQLGKGLRSKVSDSDILQQTMLDVCRNLSSLRGSSEQQCKGWLKQSLRRNIIDAARKHRGTRRQHTTHERSHENPTLLEMPIADSQTASRILMRQETDTELQNAVERLPLQQRRVIELRHQCGMTYAQIATSLGITEVAARKCWSRAASTLARELSADEQ